MAINLRESLRLPEQEWLDTDAPEVRHAWEQFTETIQEFGKIPAGHIESVLELSLHDVVGLLVQPHKTTLDLLFGLAEEATEEDLLRRSALITVNRYHVTALFRYMEKKERSSVRREQCLTLFQRVDEHRFRSFHALDWVRHFDLLFGLMDGQIETDLMRIFFEEQQMYRVAKKFDLAQEVASKTEMIELLSSPDLLKQHSYEEDQAVLFDAPHGGQTSGEESHQPEREEQFSDEDSREVETESSAWRESYQPEDVEEEVEEDAGGTAEGGAGDVRDAGDVGGAGDAWEGMAGGAVAVTSDAWEAMNEGAVADTSDAEDLEDVEDSADVYEPEDAEDAPIWQRFLESEEDTDGQGTDEDETALYDFADGSAEAGAEAEAEADESGDDLSGEALYAKDWDAEEDLNEEAGDLNEEDLNELRNWDVEGNWDAEEDLNTVGDLGLEQGHETEAEREKEADARRHADALFKWLQLDADRFVDEIFGGAEDAYEQAIDEIAAIRTWRKATEYIEKEVFGRNRVDMYDEVAVDLTDQLHSYFLEHK